MAVLTLGISYRRAPFELLERVALSDDDLSKAYRRVDDGSPIEEAVILSTCNRVEAYANVPSYHAGFLALKRLLAEPRGVEPDELAEPLYSHWGQDAAHHLFEVAAGLDSMILGETQILGQVREALRRAQSEDAAGPVLTQLFHAAVRAGRRVRSETSLGAAADAFVALGAAVAQERLGGLEGTRVVVVGAGRMAELVARHLRDRGVGAIKILNRSVAHASALADRVGADHGPLDELAAALHDTHLVVSATGAAGVVVPLDAVRRGMGRGAERRMVVLDLAVPRDVDPAVGEIQGVDLIDLVALRSRIAEHDERTEAQVERAYEIVADEVRRYEVRRRGEALAPLITALRGRGENIVRAELERSASRLARLTPDEHEAVGALARSIAAKLLHDPIVQLKERSGPGSQGAHARLLAELLGIDLDAE